MKAYTNLPFAKETAALLSKEEAFGLNFEKKDFWFWIRVMHFELRYRSIDQLLQETHCKNILELSSGYSWRGLDHCNKDAAVHYLDTDLPEVIEVKRAMVAKLQLDKEVKGHYELHTLNALNEQDFEHIIDSFNDQPLAIVNEGLLMYLNTEQKKQLCGIIHKALKNKGGYWITADVYLRRSETMRASLPQSQKEAAFFEQHNVEENKFDSYEAARKFFETQGFELVKEAVVNYQNLSVMPQLMNVLPDNMRNSKEPPPKIQATWMLKAV